MKVVLKPCSTRHAASPIHKNRVDEVIEAAVVAYAIEQPAHGQVRVSNELRKRGTFVSPSGVRSIWLRHELHNFKLRLRALEAQVAETGAVLTEDQVVALERKREEDVTAASIEAEHEQTDAAVKAKNSERRRANRGHLPAHPPREEIVIEPQSKDCPCCGGGLHVIGEDVSERLDRIPAKLKVIVTRRPKYACRSCTDGVYQAPAPARLITGGLPTEAFVADVLVSKYADHLPLYRQSQILARDGIEIHRSTLAHWVGFAAFELSPLHARLMEILTASPKTVCRRNALPGARSRTWADQERLSVGGCPR